MAFASSVRRSSYFDIDVMTIANKEPETDVTASQSPLEVVESPHPIYDAGTADAAGAGRRRLVEKKRENQRCEVLLGYDWLWMAGEEAPSGAGDETGVKGAEVSEPPNRGDTQREGKGEGATRQSQAGQLIIKLTHSQPGSEMSALEKTEESLLSLKGSYGWMMAKKCFRQK
jgi:hypothetical protein